MTRDQLNAWFNAKPEAYRKDRWGHFHYTGQGRSYRYNIRKRVICREVKTEGAGWVKLNSYYHKDTRLSEDGELTFLRKGLK